MLWYTIQFKGTTPLMAAAFNGNLNVLKQLVHASGASLSMTDSRGSSALVYAVKGGHRHIVEFFLACENVQKSLPFLHTM